MLGLREVASEKFCVWVHLFRMISLPLVCPPDGPPVGRLCAPIFGEVRPTPQEVRLMCSDAKSLSDTDGYVGNIGTSSQMQFVSIAPCAF